MVDCRYAAGDWVSVPADDVVASTVFGRFGWRRFGTDGVAVEWLVVLAGAGIFGVVGVAAAIGGNSFSCFIWCQLRLVAGVGLPTRTGWLSVATVPANHNFGAGAG